jgi:hypothetical protein
MKFCRIALARAAVSAWDQLVAALQPSSSMNRLAFVAIVLLAGVSSVRAGPVEPTHYVAAGLMLGAAEPVDNGYNVMGAIDGGYRVTELLWARAGIGYGTSVERFGQHAPNGGRNGVVRGGVEARWCAGKTLCGSAGADLGVQHGTFAQTVYSPTIITGSHESLTETALIIIPRVGIDFGGNSLRARLAVEADTALVERSTTTIDMGTPMTDSQTGVIGIELAAGVAYQW